MEVINGLNHYIGMKTLHAADFPEFSVLPYIVVCFALLYLLVAITGRYLFLKILFVLFVLFGVAAMYDFWRWEYQYGHELNPNAAIVVPGMAYQPPLIGFKQLLNFGAYSYPDIGGWIFAGVGAVTLLLLLVQWKQSRRLQPTGPLLGLLIVASTLPGCKITVTPIRVGVDACSFCKMTITDNRFGAALLTSKGKTFLFDDVHCLTSFIKEDPALTDASLFITDFLPPHALIPASDAWMVKQESIRTPMNGNVIAFLQADSAKAYARNGNGKVLTWKEMQP